MKSKLNINIEKLKEKVKLFKLNKFKALFGATLIASTLTACGTNQEYSNNSNSNNSYTEELTEEKSYIPIILNFNNYNSDIQNQEVITFLNKENEINNVLNIPSDGRISTTLEEENIKMHSKYFNETVNIPKTNENEKVEFNIDYLTKDISVSVIQDENLKAK